MNLYESTAYELHNLYKEKKVSVIEVTKAFLERIKKIDNTLGCFLEVLEEKSLERAKEIQQKFDEGKPMPFLSGIPFALKDNICTKDIKTTCASKMLSNFVPPYNATVAEKLHNENAVLLGKLNMDEFAMGSSTENSHFKKTLNPHNLEHVPGGSSGGSSSAVASSQSIFALGSDTGGSIRQPAAFCGVVGMKPTYGAVSRFGLVAFASSLDQIGPLTKDVRDMAYVLNAIVGHDEKDSTSANFNHIDYSSCLVNNVKGLKIGVPIQYLEDGIQSDVKDAILKSIEIFKSLGAEIEEFSMPLFEYAIPAYYIISSAEASSNLARFDGVKYGYRTHDFDNLSELYKKTRSEGFGDEVKRRIMLGTYALSSGYYDAYYKKAQKVRTLIKNNFDKAFLKYDIILGPTTPSTAYKFGEKSKDPIQMYLGDIYTVSVNITGLPAMSLPCGIDKNSLPIGLQLIAKHFCEGTLIKTGFTFQQNTKFNLNNVKI